MIPAQPRYHRLLDERCACCDWVCIDCGARDPVDNSGCHGIYTRVEHPNVANVGVIDTDEKRAEALAAYPPESAFR